MFYKHLSIHIISSYLYQCNKCTLIFNSEQEFKYHSQLHAIRVNLKYLKRMPTIPGVDFSNVDLTGLTTDLTNYTALEDEVIKSYVYAEITDRKISNFAMYQQYAKENIQQMALTDIISHNALIFLHLKMIRTFRKRPTKIYLSLSDIDKTIFINSTGDPMLRAIDLVCQLCKLPIVNFEQHFSPTLLKCESTCVYETYCYAAMSTHRENQYKNDCDNLFFDGHSEIPFLDDITEEQLKQAAEYNGSYSLDEEIEDIKSDFPDDPSPFYVISCRKCCIIFPTMKDAGKFKINPFDYSSFFNKFSIPLALHPFTCRAQGLNNVILTRQSLLRPLRYIDPSVESVYYTRANEFWKSALETVKLQKNLASTSKTKKVKRAKKVN